MTRWSGTSALLLFALGATACGGEDGGGASGDGGSAGMASGGSSGSGGASSGGSTASGGAGGQGAGGVPSNEIGEGTASFEGDRYRARIAMWNVPPSEEDHVCVVVALPNDEPVWIDDIHATLNGGSHHLIVDRSDATSAQLVPQSCAPTMAGDATRLIIAQQAETQVTLPEGVAFQLRARQHIFLQLHYFNPTGEARDITGTVDLILADGGETPIEAKSIFQGPFGFSIPANGPGLVESFFLPTQSGERHVFALTSHTHKLGVRSTIERVPDASAPDTTPIHESLDWAEPPLSQFDPPLVFDGSDGLRLRCRYENDTGQPVGFGTGVDQEMCFMWMYYFDP